MANPFNVAVSVSIVEDIATNEQEGLNMPEQMQKDTIINELRKRGCRVTKQRLMLLDIILSGDCSCCKEIYYKATEQDGKIGVATVYRMINTLKEIGAINRRNMYKIDTDTLACYKKIS